MIKLDAKERTIRECKAPYQFTEKGELKTEEIRVQYYSLKIKELKDYFAEIEAKAKDAETIVWLSETLAKRIHALPDILDDKDKPIAITIENLDKIDIPNLEAIKKAIDEDVKGK